MKKERLKRKRLKVAGEEEESRRLSRSIAQEMRKRIQRSKIKAIAHKIKMKSKVTMVRKSMGIMIIANQSRKKMKSRAVIKKVRRMMPKNRRMKMTRQKRERRKWKSQRRNRKKS